MKATIEKTALVSLSSEEIGKIIAALDKDDPSAKLQSQFENLYHDMEGKRFVIPRKIAIPGMDALDIVLTSDGELK